MRNTVSSTENEPQQLARQGSRTITSNEWGSYLLHRQNASWIRSMMTVRTCLESSSPCLHTFCCCCCNVGNSSRTILMIVLAQKNQQPAANSSEICAITKKINRRRALPLWHVVGYMSRSRRKRETDTQNEAQTLFVTWWGRALIKGGHGNFMSI